MTANFESDRDLLEREPELQLYEASEYWGRVEVGAIDVVGKAKGITITVAKPIVNRFFTTIGLTLPLLAGSAICGAIGLGVGGAYGVFSEPESVILGASLLALIAVFLLLMMYFKLSDGVADGVFAIKTGMDYYETSELALAIRRAVADLRDGYTIEKHRNLYRLAQQQKDVWQKRLQSRADVRRAEAAAKRRANWA